MTATLSSGLFFKLLMTNSIVFLHSASGETPLISLNSPVTKWYLKGGLDVTDGAVISFLL